MATGDDTGSVMGRAARVMDEEGSSRRQSDDDGAEERSPPAVDAAAQARARKRSRERSDAPDAEAPTPKRARFIDPVLHEPPTHPVVLTVCGHTVDASYLDQISTPVDDRAPAAPWGITCPTCKRVSLRTVRNYALETELNLPSETITQEAVAAAGRTGLMDQPSFRPIADKLAATMEAVQKERHAAYLRATASVVAEFLLPDMTKNLKTTYYLKNETHHSAAILATRDLSAVFPTVQSFFAWYSYDKRRHRYELLESGGITLVVRFWLCDSEKTKNSKKKGGDGLTWYNQSTAAAVEGSWADSAIQFDYRTTEDQRELAK